MTLFEALGGREGIDKIVEEFYSRVEQDSHMRPIYPQDLEPGKLKLFMEQWTGGGPRYSERYGHPRLRRRHFPFVIDKLAAGKWLRHMRGAMQACNVPGEAQSVIFQSWGPLAHHMVNDDEDVPREPLNDAVLQ